MTGHPSPPTGSFPTAAAGSATLDTLGGATAAAGRLPAADGARLLQVARDAFTHAVHVTAAICAVVSILAGAAALATLRAVQKH